MYYIMLAGLFSGSPYHPCVYDDALGQVAVLVEDHETLGATPHPVSPASQEPVAGAVGDPT